MSDRSQNSPNKMHWKKHFVDDPRRRNKDNDHSPAYNYRKHSNSSKSSSKSIKRRKVSKKHSISHSRTDSNSFSKSNKHSFKKGPALNYMLFVNKNYLSFFTANNDHFLRNLEKSIGDIKIHFDYNYAIPEMNGAVLVIQCEDGIRKKDAIKIILESILDLKNKENEDEKTRELKSLILVPNGKYHLKLRTCINYNWN